MRVRRKKKVSLHKKKRLRDASNEEGEPGEARESKDDGNRKKKKAAKHT